MALKAVLESLEGLPADVAKEYKQADDGKYVLDVTPVGGLALENVTGLKTALEKERTNVRNLTVSVKKFEGLDPDAARDALGRLDEIKNFDPDKKVSEAVKLREQELLKQHDKVTRDLQGKNEKMSKALEKHLVTSAVTRAISEAKGRIKLLLPHVSSCVRVRETDAGDYVAEVIDPSTGTVRVGDANGSPMTIGQLVNEFKSSDEFASAFDASGASGGGASGSGKGTSPSGGGGTRTIKMSDQKAINANLKDIAEGKVAVVE